METLADLGFPLPRDEFSSTISRTKAWYSILVDDFVRLFLAALHHQGKLPVDVQGDFEPWLAKWTDDVVSQYYEQAGFSFGDADATLVFAPRFVRDFIESELTLGPERVPLFTSRSDNRADTALRLGEILDSKDTYINLGA